MFVSCLLGGSVGVQQLCAGGECGSAATSYVCEVCAGGECASNAASAPRERSKRGGEGRGVCVNGGISPTGAGGKTGPAPVAGELLSAP